MGGSHSRPSVTVIGGGVTLSEVVSLDLGIVAAKSLLSGVLAPHSLDWRNAQIHTQSTSSKVSDSKTMELTTPVPGADFISTETSPYQK